MNMMFKNGVTSRSSASPSGTSPPTGCCRSLGTLASLATLAGLLGTVFGLIGAFRAVAKVSAAEKATVLTGAISEAMNCTAFGLLVGIPALFAHLVLAGMTKKIIDELDFYSVKLENLLITRGKGGVDGGEAPAE